VDCSIAAAYQEADHNSTFGIDQEPRTTAVPLRKGSSCRPAAMHPSVAKEKSAPALSLFTRADVIAPAG
jgi:hypothetical protein